MTLRSFARDSGDYDYLQFGRASALADACLTLRPEDGYLYLPAGFPIGAGLYDSGGVPVPFVAANAPGYRAGELTAFPLEQEPSAAQYLFRAFGEKPPDWWNEILVVPVEQPQLYLGPGDPLSVGSVIGACGADLIYEGHVGIPAFTTAGHVAQCAGSQVFDGAGTWLGTVGWCSDPTNSGLAPSVDFAVVMPATGLPFSPRISGSCNAGAGDLLEVGPNRMPAKVAAFCSYFAVSSRNATLGQLYLTNTSVSAPSDSGSPALLNGQVVGHVVGGVPGMTSLIQCIDYQLQAARPAYRGLRI